jgi:diadenosine tetraphosphate (Ap4A) HIT family hydrolase
MNNHHKTECIFCSLYESQTGIIDQNEYAFVIKDINPQASIHYLIIPKSHIKDIYDSSHYSPSVIQGMFGLAQSVSESQSIEYSKLVINNGYKAGQRVFHMHMHMLSGQEIKAV